MACRGGRRRRDGGAATLFAIGARHGVPVACLLAVSDLISEERGRARIEDEELLAAAKAMGRLALGALTP